MTDLIIDTIGKKPDRQIENRKVQAFRLVTRGTGSLMWAPFVFALALIRLWIATLRGEVDVLHINVAADGSAIRKSLLARMARRLDVPYVVHLHGSRFHQFYPSAGPWVRRRVDRLFLESSAVIVLGKYWSDLVTTHVPQVNNRIIVLPNATAPAGLVRELPVDGSVRISFLGELGPRKGTPQLVEALGRLANCRSWTATIAGNGRVQQTIERTQQLGSGDRVKVPGWLDSAAVDEVLRRTDIFVLPSFAENLPMSILEAFACGIAVIATPVGAIGDVITHQTNGLLVPPGDVDALAAALRRLIVDCNFREALGEAARRDHAEHYEIAAYTSRLSDIWRKAAARASG